MKTAIKTLIKKNSVFYILFLAWFLVTGILSLSFPKSVSFFWINHNFRSTQTDLFFTFVTFFGSEFLILTLISIFFFTKNKKLVVGLIHGLIISGLIAQVLKHLFYYPRPALYFHNAAVVKTAPWVTLYHHYSFPSGHTTAIFAAATMVSLFFSDKRLLTVFCFGVACLVAYSRVYLGEHFLEDVWLGSFIGTFCGTVCFVIQQRITKYLLYKKEAKDLSPSSENQSI